MRESIYKAARLNIFEREREGSITESQRDELFAVLEKEKADTEMTADKAMELLDEMKEAFPGAAKDLEKAAKKIEKGGDDEGSDDKGDDKGDEGGDEGDEPVSEAYIELLTQIQNL